MQKNLKVFAGMMNSSIKNEIDQVSSVLNKVIEKVNANSEAILAGERKRQQTVSQSQHQVRSTEGAQGSVEDNVRSADRSFILDGLKNTEGNDLKSAVVEALNKWMVSLNGQLVKWSLESVERISQARGDRPGAIKVVVHDPHFKRLLFKYKHELKGSDMYLKEDLDVELRGVEYDARMALKENRIAGYRVRRDHILVIFKENCNGCKVKTRQGFLDLFAFIEENGYPEDLITPRVKHNVQKEPEIVRGSEGTNVKRVEDFKGMLIDEALAKDINIDDLDLFVSRSEALVLKLKSLKAEKLAANDEAMT